MLYIMFKIINLSRSLRLSGAQDLCNYYANGDEVSLRILDQILGLLHITCA
jgi:hypothetical protein